MLGRLRPLAVLLVLLLASGLLVACGGGGSDDDPKKVLDETFSGDGDVKSGRLSVTFGLRAEGARDLDGPVSMKLSGPFQRGGDKELPRFDLGVTFSGAGQSLNAGAVATEDKGFVKFQGRTYAVPDEIFAQFKKGFEQAQNQNRDKNQNTFQALGVDPRNWLKDPKNEGTEDVGGAETIHVSSDVDVKKFLDDLDKILSRAGSLGAGQVQRLTPAQRRAAEQAIKGATFDVYSGKDDKILRRLAVRLNFEVPEAQRRQAGGLRSGTVDFSLEIADLNSDQEIKAPTGARPLSELTGALGGLGEALGGAQGGSGSGGPAQGATGGGASPGGGTGGESEGGSNQDFQRYADCLEKAGDDVAKVQKCAALLGR